MSADDKPETAAFGGRPLSMCLTERGKQPVANRAISSITLTVEQSGVTGQWYVTAALPEGGMLALGSTMSEALSRVEPALADLRAARRR